MPEMFKSGIFANIRNSEISAKKANDEPRNAGTLRPVITWNSSVPKPAKQSVEEMLSPVRTGTSTVAPNIANKC